MTTTPENFADHPESLSEVKAVAAGDAALWTPRDTLIYLLREIDSGKRPIDNIFIAFAHEGRSSYLCASKSTIETLGLIEKEKACYMDTYFRANDGG